ncbi:MAG: DegT/DnrJ/EryC1/StrS family aminotransferase [Candidatus Binataceae bacterium]
MAQRRSPRFYPVAEPDIGRLEQRYVLDAVRSGWVSSLGRYVTDFEERFADYCGATQGVSTCNGTAALHLALASLGIGDGDEVVVPSLTFVASASAVLYTGAKPVFADVEYATWCVSADAIARVLSPRTRAIIVVHLYGHPADMDPILKLAAQHRIPVVEDAAEAHGARYKGRRVGSLGKAGVFSFYGNKIITTGEGGMLLTSDKRLAERARFLRDHAMSPEERYVHAEIGYNYRLTNIQAALGLAQLERIDGFISRRCDIMRWYREALGSREDIVLNPAMPWAQSANWMVSALFPASIGADRVARGLRELGVDTRPFFKPMHMLPPFAGNGYDTRERFPVAVDLAARGLNLPTTGRLHRSDVRYIAGAVKQVLDGLYQQRQRKRRARQAGEVRA